MKKLNKEEIYINLQGKSKEELTELYWLLKNNNEKLFHNDLSVFIEEYYQTSRFLEYYNQRWGGGDNLKTEVTIQQLKEILQPMEYKEEQLRKEAKERGFVNGVKFYGSQGAEAAEPILINDNIEYMPKENEGDAYGLYVNNSWICFNGKWGTLIEETLEQQLEKAKAEVKRIEKEIEDSKIKVGDWVCRKDNCVWNIRDVHDLNINLLKDCQKITDQELINKLNNLIK